MNTLEKIAIMKLRSELYDAFDRASDKNAERMQHERIFIRGHIERCLDIVKAMMENNPELFRQELGL